MTVPPARRAACMRCALALSSTKAVSLRLLCVSLCTLTHLAARPSGIFWHMCKRMTLIRYTSRTKRLPSHTIAPL